MTVVPAIKRRRVSPSIASDASSTLVSQDTTQDIFFATAAGWDLEQNFLARKKKGRKEEPTRLPIKTAEGTIEQLRIPRAKSEDEDSWLGSGDEETQEQERPVVGQEEIKIPIRQQILEAKEELAKIASRLNENPEEHVGGFRSLLLTGQSSHPTIKKLALATQLAVYKDAIPGYRIRPISEVDQTENVSKDVRKLRAFEQTLVSCYQAYIQDLARTARPPPSDPSESKQGIASVAISCACALLLAVSHFNFRGELLKILVAKLCSRKVDPDFIKCREAIENLFRADDDGTSSLDAVGLITKMVKAHNYQVDESVLNTFLHLRLLSEFSSKASPNHVDKRTSDDHPRGKKRKAERTFRTKRERKLLKDRKVIEKEYQEADAIVSHEQRDRMQSETLKLVFVAYFRILKARVPHLMGAVLEGLSRYQHLINQDFFGDLLEALKDLMSDAKALLDTEDKLTDVEENASTTRVSSRDLTREALLCTTTAFALLEGQDAQKSASQLNLDLTAFISSLYADLLPLSLDPNIEHSSKSLRLPDPHSPQDPALQGQDSRVNLKTTTVLLLRALTSILTPRNVPPIRLAAFTKQLFTSSLQLPEKSDLAMLSLLNNVTKTHGRKIASLWNTEERRGDGVFDPLRGDLESSNPFVSTIWEGELLKNHYAPGVRDGVKSIEKLVHGIK